MGNYTVDNVQYPSVTTISGLLAKPALIQWSANMATDYILEHLDEIVAEDNVHRRREIIEGARKAHDEYRKFTADVGTLAHSAIENYIKQDNKDVTECPVEVQDVFSAFLDWCDLNQPSWVASELKIHSETLGVAGTLDGLAVINGELWLIDFKTSKTIYPKDYSLQLAAYGIAYRDRGSQFGEIKRSVILHLDWREGTVNLHDVTKNIPAMERSYKILCDFYYSYAKRRLKNPRVQEFYP